MLDISLAGIEILTRKCQYPETTLRHLFCLPVDSFRIQRYGYSISVQRINAFFQDHLNAAFQISPVMFMIDLDRLLVQCRHVLVLALEGNAVQAGEILGDLAVKVEVNTVIRGVVRPTRIMALTAAASDALMADLRRAKPSSWKGIYFKKVTVSTTNRPPVSRTRRPISSSGCQAPVDVSACTSATSFTLGWSFSAARICSGSTM